MDKLIIVLLLAGILFGQSLQLAIFGVDIPMIDVAVGLSLVLCVIGLFREGQAKLSIFIQQPLFWPIAALIVALGMSLLLNLRFLGRDEVFSPALYLLRVIAYLLVPVFLSPLLRRSQLPAYAGYFIWGLVIFACLGLLQLGILPDLGILQHLGWDPHQNRLLSTFLDPNFAGIWLTLGVGLAAALWLTEAAAKQRWFYAGAAALLVGAIVLTASRSALLSLVAVAVSLIAVRNWKWLGLAAILLVITVAASPRLADRLTSIGKFDDTTSYRIDSWQQGLTIWQANPVLGIGYNTLKFRRYDFALPGTTRLIDHAEGGFDSSLLTIAATAGLAGLATFGWLVWVGFRRALVQARSRPTMTPFSLAALGATVGLFAASWFVNAWLYPPIFITWLLLLSLMTKEYAD